MKKLLTYLSILAAAVLFTPNTAEARTYPYGAVTYISAYASCGSPIYTKKVIINHDRYGRPIYKYYSIPFVSRYNSYNRNTYNRHSSYKGKNYNSSHYSKTNNKRGHYNSGTKVRVTHRR